MTLARRRAMPPPNGADASKWHKRRQQLQTVDTDLSRHFFLPNGWK